MMHFLLAICSQVERMRADLIGIAFCLLIIIA